jgi:hypothetical protein
MNDRRAQAWGAAVIAAGALLGASAALWAGRPGELWRPLAIGLTAYVASGLLVLRWGLEVYGARGALGAVALAVFTPGTLAALAAPPLLAPAGGTTLAGGLALLAAAYALMRCLLDPTLQWALIAGVAILAAPVGAFLHGAAATPALVLAALSLLLVVCRIATAERCEPRARVVRSSVAAVAVAWIVPLAIMLAVFAASHLPSPEEYAAAHPAPAVLRVSSVDTSAMRAAGAPPDDDRSSIAALPVAALLLALLRPWRRERRYNDAGWAAALLCLGGALWLLWGAPGGVFMAPFAALLAGACWDTSRTGWARQAATALVLLQLAAALVLWPHYPGGVRGDAWLPSPDVPMPQSESAP